MKGMYHLAFLFIIIIILVDQTTPKNGILSLDPAYVHRQKCSVECTAEFLDSAEKYAMIIIEYTFDFSPPLPFSFYIFCPTVICIISIITSKLKLQQNKKHFHMIIIINKYIKINNKK